MRHCVLSREYGCISESEIKTCIMKAKLKYLLFDWGDTLMRIFPEFRGPMAEWPRVEVVSGAKEVLAELVREYGLVIATNASDSDAGEIRKALKRVELDDFIEEIFITKNMGYQRKERGFYLALADKVGCCRTEIVMIGDSYRGDVFSAKDAGLRAIWFNPQKAMAEGGEPYQDAEISTLDALPGLLRGNLLPDMAECTSLWDTYDIPANIRKHSQVVARCAYILGCRLREKGASVDVILTHRGGLLHDLDKLMTLHLINGHGETSAQILIERGYRALGEIARRHVMGNILLGEIAPSTWEEILVYYTDKIVEGDQVVSFDERLHALISRYPEYRSTMMRCVPAIRKMEKIIEEGMGISIMAALTAEI